MADQEYSEDAYATEQYDGGNYAEADQGQDQNGHDESNDRVGGPREQDDDRYAHAALSSILFIFQCVFPRTGYLEIFQGFFECHGKDFCCTMCRN